MTNHAMHELVVTLQWWLALNVVAFAWAVWRFR